MSESRPTVDKISIDAFTETRPSVGRDPGTLNEAQRLLCSKSQALEYFEALLDYATHSDLCPRDKLSAGGCDCGLHALIEQARKTFEVKECN